MGSYKKNIKGGLTEVAGTTKKYFNIGKVKLEEMDDNNTLKDIYQDLGVEFYKQIKEKKKENIQLDPKMKGIIEKINQIKKSILNKGIEIEEIKNGTTLQKKTNADSDNPHNGNGKKNVQVKSDKNKSKKIK